MAKSNNEDEIVNEMASPGEPVELNKTALPPLRSRILSSGGVIMGGFGAGQILRLVSNLILTRLLVPEAFGLMAVAVSVNIWAIMLTDIGIGASVIRSKNSDDPAFIRTAWTTGLLRNLLVWAIITIAAIAIYFLVAAQLVNADSIFANPVLPILMVAIGFQLPVGALGSMNAALAERKLVMGRVVSLEIAQQIFTMIVTISFALAGLGVWALVIGTIAGAAFSSVLSHFIYPGPTMKLQLVRRYFDEIFHFGKWLIIASFFGFILNRGDQLFFGWIMNKDAFSLYAIAGIWMMAATTLIQTVIGRVFMPAFSETLRDQPDDLAKLYRQARLPLDFVVAAMAFGAYFLAEPVFALIYPDQYAGVGYYVKLLAPALLLLPYRLINVATLASGDSKGFTAVTVVGGVAMVILMPLAAELAGDRAAILVYACIAVTTLPIVWKLGRKIMTLDWMIEGRLLVAMVLLVTLLAHNPAPA